MRIRRTDVVSIVVIGLTAALTAAVYSQLPLRMATHFDIHGNPNGWMSRAAGAWLSPALALGLWALLRFGPRVLPGSERKRLGPASAALMASLTVVFLCAVHVLVLYVSIVPGASVMHAIWILLGAFYVALGLVLPRVKRNALIGIRTPWTLTSDEVWARTQRVAGYAMVASGVVAAAFGALGGPPGVVIAVVALLSGALVPAGYSLLLARRQEGS